MFLGQLQLQLIKTYTAQRSMAHDQISLKLVMLNGYHTFCNVQYTEGVTFLSKMVYERLRCWTLGHIGAKTVVFELEISH